MKTPKERADERRQEKLEQIRDQIESGQLTIRQMTADERAEYPARPRPARQRRR